jgi:hypothetical protein
VGFFGSIPVLLQGHFPIISAPMTRLRISHMATTPQFPMPPRPTPPGAPQRPAPQTQAAAPAESQPGFAQWAQNKSKWFWLAVIAAVFIVGTIVQSLLAPTPKPQGPQGQNPRATSGTPAEAPKAADPSIK